VDGVPTSGAKSRVETQIKLSIELISRDGNKVPYWSYLRIPEFLLARSKLRKSQQQKYLDGSAAAMVSDESKVLDLEAQVICESDEKKKIKMCQGCVRREVLGNILSYIIKVLIFNNSLFYFIILAQACRKKKEF
jgi:hypothetical protein